MCVEDTERVREEPGREESVREEPGREGREEPGREGELVLLGRLHLMLGELKGLDRGLDNTLNLQKKKGAFTMHLPCQQGFMSQQNNTAIQNKFTM